MNGSSGTASVTVAAGSPTIAAPLVLDGATNVAVSNPGSTLTVSGLISGSGGLTKTGGGTLLLAGSGTYSGGTTIGAGLLQVGSNAAMGSAAAALAVNGGTLTVNLGGLVTAGSMTGNSGSVDLNGGTIRAQTISGVAMAFNSGTLEYTGSLTVASGDWLGTTSLGGRHTIGFAQQLKVDGTTTINGPLTLNGGTFSTGALVNPYADFGFTSGTFDLTSANLSVSSGGLFGSSLTLPYYPYSRTVNVTNSASIAAGASLNMQGGGFSAAMLTNSGVITIGGNVLTSSQVNAPLTNAPSGTVSANTGYNLTFAGSGNVNQGLIQIFGGAVEFTGPLTNSPGGLIEGSGNVYGPGNLIVNGGLLNSGTVAVSAYANINGTVNNGPGGLINSAGGGTTTFDNDVVNNGTIRTDTGTSTVFYGAVSGSGAFTGSGTALFESTSQLDIALAGTVAGTQYSQINVAGAAMLAGGNLAVTLQNGFRPAQNEQFTILTAGSLNGAFGGETGLNLGGGLQFVLAYTGNSLMLTAVQGGSGAWQTDGNGNVSAFTNWSGGFPNGAGETATFGPVITQPRTVTIDQPTVFGQVVLDSSSGYTLSGAPGTPGRGGNTLTLNNSGSGATITVREGQQVIDAPVVLADNLVVTGSGTLAFGSSSSIGESGGSRSLTMNGAGGTLILSGTDSYTGGTNVDAGTLYVTNTSTIADGTSLTVGAGGVFIYDPSAAGANIAAVAASAASPAATTLSVAPVPEPGTIALLLTALWMRRNLLPLCLAQID